MTSSPFSRRYREGENSSGGPGSSEGEPPEPVRATIIYAFSAYPIRIIWIDLKGNKLGVEMIEYMERKEP